MRFAMSWAFTTALSAVVLIGPAAPAEEPPAPLFVRAVAFSPDGKQLAAGYGAPPPGKGRVAVWDVATRQLRWSQEKPERVYSLSFSPDGKTLAIGTSSAQAKLLDSEKGQEQAALPGHGKGAWAVSFAPDGKSLAVGSYDGFIKIWDVATQAEVKSLEGHAGRLYTVSYSADGRLMISAGEDGVKLWDLSAGKAKHTWKHGTHSLTRIAVLTVDGRWAITGGWDGTVRVWNTENGDLRCKFSSLAGVDGLAFHQATCNLAVCAMGKNIPLLELNLQEPSAAQVAQIQRLLAKLDDDRYEVREEASQEFRALGFVAERTLHQASRESASAEVRIRARNLRRELLTQPRATLVGHSRAVETAAFSPDGALLASGGKDGTVRLWDVATRRELAQLKAEAP